MKALRFSFRYCGNEVTVKERRDRVKVSGDSEDDKSSKLYSPRQSRFDKASLAARDRDSEPSLTS